MLSGRKRHLNPIGCLFPANKEILMYERCRRRIGSDEHTKKTYTRSVLGFPGSGAIASASSSFPCTGAPYPFRLVVFFKSPTLPGAETISAAKEKRSKRFYCCKYAEKKHTRS